MKRINNIKCPMCNRENDFNDPVCICRYEEVSWLDKLENAIAYVGDWPEWCAISATIAGIMIIIGYIFDIENLFFTLIILVLAVPMIVGFLAIIIYTLLAGLALLGTIATAIIDRFFNK